MYSGGLKPLAVPQNEALITTQFGMDVVLAHPKGFELEDMMTKDCRQNADRYGGSFEVSHDMNEAFEGASFVYPKAWSPKEFFPPHGAVNLRDLSRTSNGLSFSDTIGGTSASLVS